MENKTYVLSDGRVKIVPPDREEAFQYELKSKNLTAIPYEEQVNQPESSVSSKETSPSQDNQLVTYMHNGEKHTIPKKNEVAFRSKHKGATKILDESKVKPSDRGEWSRLMKEYSQVESPPILKNPLVGYYKAHHRFIDEYGKETFKKGFNNSWLGSFFDDKSSNTVDQELTQVTPTVENMKKWVGGKWNLTKEGNLVKNFNEHYKHQPVRLEQADALRDAVRVVFENSDGSEHKSHIINLSSKDSRKSTFREISTWVGDVPESALQDIINHVDRMSGKKDDDTAIYNTLKDIKSINRGGGTTEEADKIAFIEDLEKKGGTTIDGGRFSTGKRGERVVDMSGYITINGTNYSYEYLWNQKDNFRYAHWGEEHVRYKNLIKQKVGSLNPDGTVNTLAKGATNEEIDDWIHRSQYAALKPESQKITDIRREIELLEGGKATNMFMNYGIWTDVEEAKLKKERIFWKIGLKGDLHRFGHKIDKSKDNKDIVDISKEEAEPRIRHLQGIIDKYKAANPDLYDEDGVVKTIKREQWIENPDDPTEMIKLDFDGKLTDITRPKDRSDDKEYIENLAKEMKLEDLLELRREAVYRLTHSTHLMHENMDYVKGQQNAILWGWNAVFDANQTSLNNDEDNIKQAVENGNIFEIGGGWNGTEDVFLTDVRGGGDMIEYHNQNVLDFKILNEAIEMNVNPLEANQEGIVSTFVNGVTRNFTGENIVGGEYTKWQMSDGFEAIIKQSGFESDDIQNTSWYGRGNKNRYLGNLAANTVSSLAPLLAELYVFKRLGGLKAIQKTVGGVSTPATMGHSISTLPKAGTGFIGMLEREGLKAARLLEKKGYAKLGNYVSRFNTSKWFAPIVNGVMVPAIVTPIEWGMAEYAGERLLSDGSGIWDGHTIHRDPKTGEIKTNFIFPAAMGAAGGMFGMVTKSLQRGFSNQLKGAKTWSTNALGVKVAVPNPIRKIAPVYERVAMSAWAPVPKAVGGVVGQGSTATFLLTVAGAVEHVKNKIEAGYSPWEGVDLNTEEGRRLRDEWQQMTSWDHLFSTTIAMMTLGKGLPKKFKKSMVDTYNRMRSETEATVKAGKDLGMSKYKKHKDGTYDPNSINEAERKAIEEVEAEIQAIKDSKARLMNRGEYDAKKEADLIAEQNNKIKNIRESAETLRNRNEIIEIKKGLTAENKIKSRKQIEKEYFITTEMLSGEKTGAELEVLDSLDPIEFQKHLLHMGIREGSSIYNTYMYVYNEVRVSSYIASHYGFGVKDWRNEDTGEVYSKELKSKWSEYVSNHHKIAIHAAKQEQLRELMKEEPKRKEEIIQQLKNLAAEKKMLVEKTDKLTKEYEKDFKRRLNLKLKNEKTVIEAEKDFYEGREDKVFAGEYNIIKDKLGKSSSEIFAEKINEISRKQAIEKVKKDLEEGKIDEIEADAEINRIKNKNYYQGETAFYTEDGRAFIDYGKALKNHSLTEGTHEINHMLLRDYYKEDAYVYDNVAYNKTKLDKLKNSKNKKDVDLYKRIKAKGEQKRVFSEKGMEIVDYMLEQLTPEEMKVVMGRMNRSYIWRFKGYDHTGKATFEEIDGKKVENNKFDYYEEYIPVLGQAIAKGAIERGPNLGRRIGKALFPHLKIWNPNAYKFELNGPDSRKAGNDLMLFVEALYTKGLTKNVLEVARKGGFGEGIKNQNIQASKYISGFEKTADTNAKLYQNIVDHAKKNNIPLDRFSRTKPTKLNPKGIKTFDAVTPEMRQKLVDNNMWIAEWLASHPQYGGKGVMSGGIYDQATRDRFRDDFKIELENFARTFNPKLNDNFPAYVLQSKGIKTRYADIVDKIIKEQRALSLSKPVGEKGTLQDIIEGEVDSRVESFEGQDLSFGKPKRPRIQGVENNIEQSTLRKEIGIENYEKSEIFQSIKSQLLSKTYVPHGAKRGVTQPTKSIVEKGGSKALENQTEYTLYDRLDKTMTIPELLKHRKAILNAIPIHQLIQMQKMLPADQKLIKEIVNTETTAGKWSTEKALREFMGIKDLSVTDKNNKPIDSPTWDYNRGGKNLLPELRKQYESHPESAEYAEYKRRKGVGIRVFERLEMNTAQFENWLTKETPGPRQQAAKSGTLWNNRNNLLRKLSTAITKDAIPEILKDKDFVDRYIESKDLKNQIEAKALIEKFVFEIGKSEGLQFSKDVSDRISTVQKELGKEGLTKGRRNKLAKELASLQKLEAGSAKIERMWQAALDIADFGAHKVFDLRTKKGENVSLEIVELTKEFKKKHPDLTKLETEYLFKELVLKDKIFNHEGLKLDKILKARDAFNKDIIKSGKERSGGFEQWVINNFKKIKGIKVLTEVATEVGDLPDVHAEIRGERFNIEVKMFKAQLGSLTSSVNTINGIAEGVSTKNFNKFRKENRDKINALLKETTTEWVEIRKQYKELSKINHPEMTAEHKKLLENFKNSKDPVPRWAYKILLDQGAFSRMSKLGTGEFTETLIEDVYQNKKHPSFYMYWLGRGMFHLGKNPHALNTTKLEGTFYGKWRYDTHSLKTKYGTEHNLVTTNLRFIPSAKNVTSKSTVDILTKEGRDNLSKSVSSTSGNMASKSIENYKRVVTASKSVSGTRDFIQNGKKKGMSTFDFDDTMAYTKSGVRVTIPNPSGTPKPGKKVVFLAGGAGSGKGNVVKKLGLEKDGFKIVNQDISLEWLKKNHGLPENMKDLTKEQRSTLGKLGHQARGIAKRKMMKFQGKGDGVVVDGTGGSIKNMEKLVNEFKDKGYDVSMVFVETSLKTALERNRARKERSLLDVIVERNHASVQGNKSGFKDMFGERFMEVKTDNLRMEDPMPTELVSKMKDFVSGYEKLRLDAAEFATQGDIILKRGGEFDFSEFNKVVEGTEGPYLQKAIERAKKYGTKDMFILTARPAESAAAIQAFLKSQGLNIPIENITGLANSSGNAKAKWMLEKFAEGYNDMYFVDDALPNVKAVKKVLDQLDIKSKVVQAKVQASKDISAEINNMLARQSKIPAGKRISLQEAKLLGKGKGKFDYFVPPSAEDFKGLMYKLLGKGEQGNKDMKFFKETLFKPFAEGTRDLTIVKQKMAEEYKALKKGNKDVKLDKIIEGTPFTVDHALRTYLWEKAGHEVPGIDAAQKKQLIDYVNNNSKLVNYAETLNSITRLKNGYTKPGEYWMVENIASDLNQMVKGETRSQFLQEWIDNKNLIFSTENMNKIEAIHGKWYRESLENILYRMETGTNRLSGIKDGPTKWWYDWVNGSVGATMFWNTRSAMLQTISTVNFTNLADNNPLAQAKAFMNQPQFWKDFAMIFNSPMLKQRRGGLQMDVSASELTSAFESGNRNPKAILQKFLQWGFTPTRIADSFAIAMGGSGFYRNRLNKYIKEGLSLVKAKEKAWLDFQEIAEETQQSSRPDLISQQQAGPLGRLILAWQNTPMQMTRLMKKKLSDVVNRRKKEGQTQLQSDIANLSGIAYYGAIQNLWFMTLQSGLAWLMFGSDMEDKIEKKELQVVNGAFDTLLRGTGVYGAAISTLKNTYLRYQAEKKKGWNKDLGNVVVEAINVSPPIGAKVRKGYSAIKTWEYNQGVSEHLPWYSVENPNLHATANIIEGLTNVPMARVVNKANNLEEVVTGNHETWQKVAMVGGWNRWNVGAEDEELEEAKAKAKETRSERNKEKKKQEKKDKGLKQVRCSGTKSGGGRCSNTTWTDKKSWKCAHHMAFKDGMDRDGDGVKEYRCKATTSSGKRCRNKTENKNKRCYAHQ